MPKRYTRECDQCRTTYTGSGKQFCGRSCQRTWLNNQSNPSLSEVARAKIADSRAGKPTTTGRIIPQAQRDNIAAALRGKTLSAEHRQAIGDGVKRAGNIPPRNPHLVGAHHPNWKGGFTPARRVDYKTPRYVAFRFAVLNRDRGTCQDCGYSGTRLHVHHLKAWGPYPEFRYDPDNGITLCHPCHHSRHRGVPRPVTVGPRTLAERESGRA